VPLFDIQRHLEIGAPGQIMFSWMHHAAGFGARPAQRIKLPDGFQQLVWRARYDVLILELVALTGSPVSRKLTFDAARQRRLQKTRRMLEG
jgi:hypothetical protein